MGGAQVGLSERRRLKECGDLRVERGGAKGEAANVVTDAKKASPDNCIEEPTSNAAQG